MQTQELVREYIKSKALSWAPSTCKTVSAKLSVLGDVVLDNCGNKLLSATGDSKPYSKKTVFINVANFTDWLIETGRIVGPNNVREFMRENARLFKYVYTPEKLDKELTVEEVKRRLDSIKDADAKSAAQTLLLGGLRYCELETLKNDSVVGKGGRTRKVFVVGRDGSRIQYSRLYRALKSVGLKPHTLRKVHATALARAGVDFKTLMEFMGWHSTQTAASYIQTVKEEQMVNIARGVFGE